MAQKRDLAVYLDVPVPPYEPLSRFQEFQVFAEDKILERQAIRIEKGDTRVTVSELGLSHHRIYRDHVLVFPPFLPVQGEWERADGRVARFSFSQRFFGAIADQVGPPLPVNDFWHAFFAIDQQLEALCRLLTEETESQCPHGRLYFEPLAN